MKKLIRRIVGGVLLAVVLVVGSYVGYVYFSYSRIPDNTPVEVFATGKEEKLQTGTTYRAVSYNIGFGAYTPEFTFFMDGGTQSWAESPESVMDCIEGAAQVAAGQDADILLFQEVDFDSTRSYHIDQRKMLLEKFADYSSAFAVNYQSAFLMYPFHQPHGASNSGILTLSRYNMTQSERRSLPISESVTKILDLDRCYSVSRIPVENGKELVVYNVHMSAYGGSDEIRAAQMGMLFEDMRQEYGKGNYCICGGDYNHDFTGDSTQQLNGGQTADFGWAKPFPEDMLPDCIVRCTEYDSLIPTCRNCDIPYREGNFTLIVDGFLVTKNVTVLKVSNISTGFAYADHNPVALEFILEG